MCGQDKREVFTGAIHEDIKRLSRYGEASIIEVADEKTPDTLPRQKKSRLKKLRESGYWQKFVTVCM